ncbi:MAG: lysylphosphatidylglycerol synthase domain-containing protein [Geminicoccaceae bacterium]
MAIVTTADTGCAEVVGDAALLVPSGDVPALGAALDRLIGDPALRARLGARARRHFERAFTWTTVAATHERLYRRSWPNGRSLPMPDKIPWARLRIAVAALALGALFLAIPPATVLDAWRDARPGLLALGMAWMAAAAVASSAAFYATLRLRGIAPPLAEVVRTDIAGHFYTFTAPFGVVAGGAARVLRLQGPGRPMASLIGAILTNRLVNIWAAAALACLALVAVRPAIGATWPVWLLLLSGIAGLALAARLAAHHRRIRLLVAGRFVPLLPLAPQRRRRIRRTLRRLGGAGGTTSLPLHLVPVALVVLRHLCSAAALAAFAAAFGLDLGFVASLWVRMALNVAMLVPLAGGTGRARGRLRRPSDALRRARERRARHRPLRAGLSDRRRRHRRPLRADGLAQGRQAGKVSDTTCPPAPVEESGKLGADDARRTSADTRTPCRKREQRISSASRCRESMIARETPGLILINAFTRLARNQLQAMMIIVPKSVAGPQRRLRSTDADRGSSRLDSGGSADGHDRDRGPDLAGPRFSRPGPIRRSDDRASSPAHWCCPH